MPKYLSVGGAGSAIDRAALEAHLDTLIDRLITQPGAERLLIVPPDITRLNSRAGEITAYLWDKLHETVHIDILPALGTHKPMTPGQCEKLFGPTVPFDRVIAHDWRNDLAPLGEVSAQRMGELSGGRFAEPMRVAINKRLMEGGYDRILSIGQVVPHEVIGMANYTKNIMIGVGGKDTIDKSHFLGAVCGMESIMGQADTPVRRALNGAYDTLVRDRLPITFILTVIGDSADGLVMRGLYAGDGDDTFEQAAALSKQVNFDVLDAPIKRCVVYLDPDEFHSTWLGNKAIYRTRMAMADDGELIVLAPAVNTFGEDADIDTLIRKHGYRGTPGTLQALDQDADLAGNLSAAAHLIHGSTEGRFTVTYCTTDALPREAIEQVGYQHRDYADAVKQYPPEQLGHSAGWHTDADGEPFFYIPNPALGLWAARARLS
ncbi:lactate racemase domain-containing protein [Phycisphaeraceae bacterium D3-23]